MDSEEFDQIPWSSLVTDKTQGVDKRVYLAVGVVGVIVAVIFGSRLLGGSQTQPVPVVETAPQVVPATSETTTSAGMIVSEADLMAPSSADGRIAPDIRVETFAEWFVTDYYTMDGSSETERSVHALMASTAEDLTLPHTADPSPHTTYVEWARSVASRLLREDELEVDVVYRTITETEDGFVRDPIAAVVVTLRIGGPGSGVIAAPVSIPVPGLGSLTPDSPPMSP